MKHLKVWQKLALMGAVCALPFAAVSYALVSSVQEDGLIFARKQLRGLEFNKPALALVKSLQLHRGLSYVALSCDAALSGDLSMVRADVESRIAGVDAEAQRLDSALNIGDRWVAWRDAARELLQQSASLSADESFARHSRLIGEAVSMIGDIGHTTNLTLDPDDARDHLAETLLFDGPALAESLARARDLGAVVANLDKRTADQTQRLTREAVLVEYLGARMDESMTGAIEANEELRPRLEPAATAASDAVLDAMSGTVQLANGDSAGASPAQYFATLSKAIDTIAALETTLSDTMARQIDARIEELRWELAQTLGWALVGVLFVTLFGLFIMRDITVPLKEIVAVANVVARGDVSLRIKATARRDELGDLARAFETMTGTAKEMAHVAEQIAGGDLSVPVTPRSEKDVLGVALTKMVDRLATLLGEVHRSGIQVNTSVTDIAATARQQQTTASEIAATTSEIGATSKQISATSKELVKTMTEVASVADQTATLAGSGQVGVTRMESTMSHVMEAAASINGKLAVLNEKAGNINQVVTTITKVADQTNLLSLNAAIEAEKAGEYGRGFAVVATEIRRLADQTAVATYDIEQMVKEIQSAVAAGVMGMDKFSEEVRRGMREVQDVGGQLSQIIQQVQALAPRVEAVNEGVQAQATGAEQITQALVQLSDAAQQTVESLRQSSHAIEGLNMAASGMHSGVSRFKLVA
jgi:methyl-accepting chemotaxis protein WspA